MDGVTISVQEKIADKSDAGMAKGNKPVIGVFSIDQVVSPGSVEASVSGPE
jgi:hypothetical protein